MSLLKRLLVLVPVIAAFSIIGCTEDDGDGDDNPTDPGSIMEDGLRIFTDSDINAGETVTLSADTAYLLKGFVFVEDGATLEIPAGTVIKGAAGGGLNASALIICRGGMIDAQGTASDPIIMTSKADNLDYTDDLGSGARGLWGGLIVLGKASTNRAAGEEQIEGIDPNDDRGLYGGSDDADNSGTIQYVSIRYGGTNIGDGNEINGLTMGAVGSGTTIDHIEVYNNADDGFEWFGGTVNTKYLASIGNGDDSFDWDEGFRGNGQYWLVRQASDGGDLGIEADGCASDNRGGGNESMPTIYNATFIGCGADAGVDGNMAFKLREETGAHIMNSIITGFSGNSKLDSNNTVVAAYVIDIDDGAGTNIVSDQIQSGTCKISNCLMYDFGYGFTDVDELVAIDGGATFVRDSIASWNTIGTSAGVDRDNLLPTAGGAAFTSPMASVMGTFFDDVSYIGAFGSTDWTSGWTFLSQL